MSVSEIFKAFSDPVRRDIAELLRDGRLNAGELSEQLNISPAALSYHLRILKAADIVMEYRSKNYIYYELNVTVFDELVLWVSRFCIEEQGQEDIVK